MSLGPVRCLQARSLGRLVPIFVALDVGDLCRLISGRAGHNQSRFLAHAVEHDRSRGTGSDRRRDPLGPSTLFPLRQLCHRDDMPELDWEPLLESLGEPFEFSEEATVIGLLRRAATGLAHLEESPNRPGDSDRLRAASFAVHRALIEMAPFG